jgi:hypothetical protein
MNKLRVLSFVFVELHTSQLLNANCEVVKFQVVGSQFVFRLIKMPYFRDIRNALVVAMDDGYLSDDEFVILFDAFVFPVPVRLFPVFPGRPDMVADLLHRLIREIVRDISCNRFSMVRQELALSGVPATC